MFRSRRSGLVKRLWKCRHPLAGPSNEAQGSAETPSQSPSSNSEDLETKSVTQSMLKRLKEKQLEVLVQSVESKGGETTGCVLVPRDEVRLGRRTVAPHVLCCQVWRWPELGLPDQEFTLKRLPCCTTANQDVTSVCCNPYHWSLLYVPETPPPPYTTEVLERVIKQDAEVNEEVVSTETGGTPTHLRWTPSGGSGSHSMHRRPYWCNIAYWEHRQRVGRLFTVFEPTVNVFQQLPHGDGLCLSVLQEDTKTESIRRTREKIGFGVTLSKEDDGVWVYNRSDYPIFVNSPTLDVPNARTFSVWKVQPGYSIKMFDHKQSEVLKVTRDPQLLDGPYDPNAVRISFAKGWGSCYSRQFITSCPCWIEVLLSVNR